MKISRNQLLDFRDRLIPFLILGLIFGPFILNYSGFCFAKGKYLSFDDKLKIVFNLNNNSSILINRLSIDNRKQDQKDYLDVKYISYTSFEEFSKLNPNCCKISIRSGDQRGSDFWDRIFGYDTGEFVEIKFKFRYFDKNGYAEKTTSREAYLTNCGRIWHYL